MVILYSLTSLILTDLLQKQRFNFLEVVILVLLLPTLESH